MPKVLGFNIVAVAAASVAFFIVGFLWYGVIFADAWMAAEGVTAEEANPVWMVGGFVITIMQVLGLALILRWKGALTPMAAVQTAAIVWALLALPFSLYAYLYLPAHNTTLLAIDASHLLVGWLVSAGVLSLLKV